jgi:hypothetical protein
MTVALDQSRTRRNPALALRFAARELRGGLRGFYVFIACIALGVMAIAGIGSVADGLAVGEERALVRARFTQAQREREVATENDAAFAREPVREPRRDRVDAGNGHDPERDAADEHVEAAQAPAQFAECEAQRQQLAGAFVGG